MAGSCAEQEQGGKGWNNNCVVIGSLSRFPKTRFFHFATQSPRKRGGLDVNVFSAERIGYERVCYKICLR